MQTNQHPPADAFDDLVEEISKEIAAKGREAQSLSFVADIEDKVRWEEITSPHTGKVYHIPYVASAQVTVLGADGVETVRNIFPPYINNLHHWAESKSDKSFQNAIVSMCRETLLSLIRTGRLIIKGWEAPIAVSAGVPENAVMTDGQRIILNEAQAAGYANDADGDRGMLHHGDPRYEMVCNQATLVKFPITQVPLNLECLPGLPKEKFYDFTLKMFRKVLEDNPVREIVANTPKFFGTMAQQEEKAAEWGKTHFSYCEYALKKHKDVPVGRLTSGWNVWELHQAKLLGLSKEDTLRFIFTNYGRYADIELGGMKAARKTGRQFKEAEVLKFRKALSVKHAWALTSCSSVGDMRADQILWAGQENLMPILQEITDLKLEFRKTNPPQGKAPKECCIDGGLVKRLADLGLLRWMDFPPVKGFEHMPSACMVWLTLPNGEPVALTSVKRDNGREEGLTYAFVLPPVWDNLNLWDEDGQNIIWKAEQKWVHPVAHMAKLLSRTTVTKVINPTTGDISSMFPVSYEDWCNPKREMKVATIQQAIAEHCGIYGDPCPAHFVNKKLVPSGMARSITSRSGLIDFGQDMNEFQMLSIILQANKTCKLCFAGSKSDSRRLRKYMFADNKGRSIVAHKSAHPGRPGANRAQLQRSLKPVKVNVAIVKMDTQTQILMCPSGIEKQKTSEAFMPQTFNTWLDWENYCKGHGYNLEDEKNQPKRVEYSTWTGERRVCWTWNAKSAIKIGKLVDVDGNKFLPRQFQQVKGYVTSNKAHKASARSRRMVEMEEIEIDLLFPYTEGVDKENIHAFDQNPREITLEIPQGAGNPPEYVQAVVVERTFYRTGAASENVPPRNRHAQYRGIDARPIWAQVVRINPTVDWKPWNIGFARELQTQARALQGLDPVTPLPTSRVSA